MMKHEMQLTGIYMSRPAGPRSGEEYLVGGLKTRILLVSHRYGRHFMHSNPGSAAEPSRRYVCKHMRLRVLTGSAALP